MTDEERRRVKQFEARVRQLIAQHKRLQQTAAELTETIRRKDADIAELEHRLQATQADYENLKIAKMMEISDGDLVKARVRISQLVRKVNRCIALMSGDDLTVPEGPTSAEGLQTEDSTMADGFEFELDAAAFDDLATENPEDDGRE